MHMLFLSFVKFAVLSSAVATSLHGGFITPMALAHPLHPIRSRSRNKRRNLQVERCVPPDDPGSGPHMYIIGKLNVSLNRYCEL